jgi:uncharacterized membrane protein YkvA (DUF1232 family)
MKNILVLISSALSVLYLLNPGLGVFELIPDNLPLIGNIDEGLAAYILYSAIEYLREKPIGLFK